MCTIDRLTIDRSLVSRSNRGVMAMDALHVACAEHIGAEYFVTCDDTLFKKLNRLESTKMQAVTVMDFMSKEVFQS